MDLNPKESPKVPVTVPAGDFNAQECLEGTLTLPIGLFLEGRRVKNIKLHEFTDLTLERIHDPKLRKGGPISWSSKVAALCIESIEGVPVFADFEASNFREIPKIVLDIPTFDSIAIFLGAQIFNYGTILSGVQVKCGSCKKEFEANFDLDKISLIGNQLTEGLATFRVDLPIGFRSSETQYAETLFNILQIQIPTFRHALKHIDYMQNSVAFSRRVYYSATKSLESEDGTTFPETEFKSLGTALYNGMKPRDRSALSAVLEKAPQIDPKVELECPHCGAEVRSRLEQDFFFQA